MKSKLHTQSHCLGTATALALLVAACSAQVERQAGVCRLLCTLIQRDNHGFDVPTGKRVALLVGWVVACR